MGQDKIKIHGAREHNLKNIDLEIPRDKFVVLTGLSGSGKSSLAFDTIFAEGQRRYVESLSSYARQFLGQMEKPDVDYIEGLSPSISIDQKGAPTNPRSTVGTVTEIYDYLRLLYARIGKLHCYKCGKPISAQTVDQMVDKVMDFPEGTKVHVLAPVVTGRKGEYKKLLEDVRRAGFVRVRINGEVMEIPERINLERYKMHTIEVVVDRLMVNKESSRRLADSLETALKVGQGVATVLPDGDGAQIRKARGERREARGQPKGMKHLDSRGLTFSEKFSCVDCGVSFGDVAPRLFSFNSPYGACTSCDGLGIKMEVDPGLIVHDREKSIADRGILPWGITTSNFYHNVVKTVAQECGVDIYTPVKNLQKDFIKFLLHGGDEILPIRVHFRNRIGLPRVVRVNFKGLVPMLEKRYEDTDSEFMMWEIEKYMSETTCADCRGAKLKPESLAVTVGGKNIARLCSLSIGDAHGFVENLNTTEREQLIAHQIFKEIKARLNFLLNVGLNYLTLDRTASTLAGGEAQRIRLATQIGSGLMGVLYILDEPSIGLHQRDNARLLATLKRLRDLGNTVLVVEHDEETIRSADYVVDLGPGAGKAGGSVVVTGTVDDVMKSEESITGKYLSRKLTIPVPAQRRKPKPGKSIVVTGARQFNLKNITVEIPLGLFVCITGVSGSGKSTLVDEILYKGLRQHLYGSVEKPGEFDEIKGMKLIDKVIEIDQSPIGRTPRSNPATYTKVFDLIRTLFSMTPEARMKGYKPGRFSFNVKGGRCEACQGEGLIKIEMHFLPDVYVPCEVCKGKRYNRETLQVHYKGKTISDVLGMRVEDALEFFANMPKIREILQTLYDVGLGYIELGQFATTLSGGEAQRVKLSAELSRRATGNTLYILDEPTTGLHFDDIKKLLSVLQRLVEGGNTVVVIEHNLDVIKCADYIIDLGPEGGDEGGYVIAAGTPEKVMNVEGSYTGQFLKRCCST